jgi:hypothetical protein
MDKYEQEIRRRQAYNLKLQQIELAHQQNMAMIRAQGQAIYPPQENDYIENTKEKKLNLDTTQNKKFEGIKFNQDGQIKNIPIIYGLRKITPIRVFASLAKGDNKKLFAVYVLSEGPITKVNRLYIDGNEIPLNSVTTATIHKPSTGPYALNFRLEFYNGNPTTQISNLLVGVTKNIGDLLPLLNSLQNMAYIVCEFTYSDGSPYKSEPKIEVEVCGRKLRDADSIGAEQNVFSDANPADVILDLMTNSLYGAGIDDAKIDTTSLASMSASFDTTITPYRNSTSIKRMSCNMIMDSQKTPLANIKEMIRQFDMSITYANGLYRFVANYADPGGARTVLTVTESNIVGSWQINEVQVEDRKNKATVTYPDREIGYTEYAQVYTNDTFVADDDNRVNEEQINLSGVTDPYIARNYAQTLVRRNRDAAMYRFRMTKEAIQLTVGDILVFAVDGTNQKLVITGLKIDYDLTVDIDAVRHKDSYYPEFDLLPKVKYNLLDLVSITGTTTNNDATVPSEPPPITPPAEDTGTYTISLVDDVFAETLTNVPQNADVFIRGKWIDVNYSSDYSNVDYRVAIGTTGGRKDHGRMSLQRLYNTSGTTIEFEFDNSFAYQGLAYIEYNPNVTCRYRDQGITFNGETADGMLIIGNNKIENIYYAYPVAQVDGRISYGWQNGINFGFETVIFDPETDFAAFRAVNGNLSRDQVPIQLAVEGGYPFARFPCPRMAYDLEGGYYAGVGSNRSTIAGNNITGMRYYLEGLNKKNNLYHNALDPTTTNIVNNETLFGRFIKNNQKTYDGSTDSNNSIVTLKLFAVLDTPLGGVPYYLGNYTQNLRPQRCGDRSMGSQNYWNWIGWRPFPPFTFVNPTQTGGLIG